MINVFRAQDQQGREAIALVLSPESMFISAEGDPYPGVALYLPQARELAYRLLLFAQEIENGRPMNPHSSDSTGKFRGDHEAR